MDEDALRPITNPNKLFPAEGIFPHRRIFRKHLSEWSISRWDEERYRYRYYRYAADVIAGAFAEFVKKDCIALQAVCDSTPMKLFIKGHRIHLESTLDVVPPSTPMGNHTGDLQNCLYQNQARRQE